MVKKLIGAVAIAAGYACGGDAAADVPVRQAEQFVVAIDISKSRAETDLVDSHALLRSLIETQLADGDRIVLTEMEGIGSGPRREHLDSIRAFTAKQRNSAGAIGQRRAAIDRSLRMGAMFFDPARANTIRNTDVLGTLVRVAAYARGSGGRRTTALLLSDMIQSTPELRMETAAVPSLDWIAQRKSRGQLPDLRGVCVGVAGAEVRSDRGAAIRDFWLAYVKEAGGEISSYERMIASVEGMECRR